MNESTISDFEDVASQQNDNLGPDVASIDGTTTFRKHPVLYIPYLDDNAVQTNPIYMIDHSTWNPIVLKGDYLRETTPAKAAKQHNVFECFVDLSYNFICVDRRRNAVLYQA